MNNITKTILMSYLTQANAAPAEYKMPKGIPYDIIRTEAADGSSKNYFRYAATNIPHDDKKHKGGEDAYLASNNLLVVADGVGGWADEGVDSGLFSKKLVADIKV